jgi:hypothetical protein
LNNGVTLLSRSAIGFSARCFLHVLNPFCKEEVMGEVAEELGKVVQDTADVGSSKGCLI